jgi:hypothetical protein
MAAKRWVGQVEPQHVPLLGGARPPGGLNPGAAARARRRARRPRATAVACSCVNLQVASPSCSWGAILQVGVAEGRNGAVEGVATGCAEGATTRACGATCGRRRERQGGHEFAGAPRVLSGEAPEPLILSALSPSRRRVNRRGGDWGPSWRSERRTKPGSRPAGDASIWVEGSPATAVAANLTRGTKIVIGPPRKCLRSARRHDRTEARLKNRPGAGKRRRVGSSV